MLLLYLKYSDVLNPLSIHMVEFPLRFDFTPKMVILCMKLVRDVAAFDQQKKKINLRHT